MGNRILSFMLFFQCLLWAQEGGEEKKLSFTGDFRFRLEADWNSRRSDGSFREDRTRLRYHFHFRLVMRHFLVEQLIPYGIAKETGERKFFSPTQFPTVQIIKANFWNWEEK